MSVTVTFSDGEGGKLKVVVPYNNGDHNVSAMHLTCVGDARRYGKNYIDRTLKNKENE